MPEILRSLMVVLFIAFAVYVSAKRPITETMLSETSFITRRNAWFGITLTAFLANNFWIFATISALILHFYAKRDTNKMALVFSILFAVPLFKAEISGLGIVNYLFDITYFRILSLIILFPLYLTLRKEKENIPFGHTLPDKFLAAYLLLGLILQFPIDSITNTLRTAFYIFIDIYLPYYVASRYFKNVNALREALATFVLAAVVIGIIGTFEFAKGWLLFSNVAGSLGLSWALGGYLSRGESLRALASTGQAIVLGYVMAVALGFYLFVSNALVGKKIKMIGFFAIIAGLIAPLSRGPWLGATLTYLVFVSTGPKAIVNLSKLLLLGTIIFLITLATPVGNQIIDHLPFVGTVDSDNVIYRERLLTNSLQVISRNPFFGSFDYYQSNELEELRSGGEDGIIDLVNSYLAIALSSGIVGLTLFLSFFGSICLMVLSKARRVAAFDEQSAILGRALLATLVGILFTIYTVSSITFIPIIYWFVGGLGLSYINLPVKAKHLSNIPAVSFEHVNLEGSTTLDNSI